jgi:hypothetical protein
VLLPKGPRDLAKLNAIVLNTSWDNELNSSFGITLTCFSFEYFKNKIDKEGFYE